MDKDENTFIDQYSTLREKSPGGGNGSAVSTTPTTEPTITALSMKHEKFCQEFLIDMVGSKAARRAGYSAESAANQGYILLQRPDVQARLAEIQAEVMQRTSTDQDYVIVKLRNWSDSKITDYFDIEGRGEKKRLVLKDLGNLPGYVIDCIQEIRQAADGSISIKLVDKRGAATDIGRHLGMFTDNLIVTPLSFEALMRARQEEVAKQVEEAAK